MSDLVKKIAKDFGAPRSVIERMISSGPYRYKTYFLPKRTGGTRLIAQPTPGVKDIQRWIVNNIFERCPISNNAVGYRAGMGIRENASAHINSLYLLKMDFKDFFASIRRKDIEFYLSRTCDQELDPEDIQKISRVVCWSNPEGHMTLCIGAPSSPIISNVLLKTFDDLVGAKCDDVGVIYTRYSDDLAFSCSEPGVLKKIEVEIAKIVEGLESPRLAINSEKTIHASRASRRQVTGLVLTPQNQVSVGRERKRLIRAMIDRLRKNELDKDGLRQLQGYLAFVLSIEPDFISRMKQKYGDDIVNFALRRQSK